MYTRVFSEIKALVLFLQNALFYIKNSVWFIDVTLWESLDVYASHFKIIDEYFPDPIRTCKSFCEGTETVNLVLRAPLGAHLHFFHFCT
jgi:hypothetical protein